MCFIHPRKAMVSLGVPRELSLVGKKRGKELAWTVDCLEGRLLLSAATQQTGEAVPAQLSFHPGQNRTSIAVQATTESSPHGNREILVATVNTAEGRRVVRSGNVRFFETGQNPTDLGMTHINKLGEAIIATSRLSVGGPVNIEAEYIPNVRQFTPSSTTMNVTVSSSTVTSFRITAPQHFGSPGTPVTFSVIALDHQDQPVANYTGTISLFSPTDHQSKFSTKQYTFTTADQGIHNFPDGVTFHKGGSETLEVDQVSNTQIRGKTNFGIE